MDVISEGATKNACAGIKVALNYCVTFRFIALVEMHAIMPDYKCSAGIITHSLLAVRSTVVIDNISVRETDICKHLITNYSKVKAQ